MRPSRLLPAAALLLVPALLVAEAGAQPSAPSERATVSAADRATVAARVRQRGTLTMHPQLSQPGDRPAAAGSAKSSMTASFKPAKKGRKVVLQRRKGRRWVTLAGARRQNRFGVVEFNASYKVKGRIPAYRALAVRFRGLPKKTTNAARTNRWGDPDLTDEFSGYSLPVNWMHRPTSYDGMRQCATANPENIAVGDGSLSLSVTKNTQGRQTDTVLGLPVYDTTCEVDGTSYDYRFTGHVSTQNTRTFQYGFAAARIKFQRGAGQHGAFWMMPAQSTPTNPGTEIDVTEFFGDRQDNSTFLTSFVQRTFTDPPVKDTTCGRVRKPSSFGSGWWTSYHVFSVEWTESRYVFRIDGRETCRTSKLVSHTPEYLILSLQANDYELHYSKSLPQHMSVDWVRYWQP